MKLAELMQEATRIQIKFANREDSELQALRAHHWNAVEQEINRLIEEAHERTVRLPTQRRQNR